MTGLPGARLRGSGNKWHVDRSVPVAIILTVAAHSGVGIWFAAKLDARLSAAEQFVAENKTTDRRLAVIESRLGSMDATLERIDRKLDAPSFEKRSEIFDTPRL